MNTEDLDNPLGSHVAIVGGGAFAHELLRFLLDPPEDEDAPRVVAIVDIDPEAPGVRYARDHGIAVYADHRPVLELPALDTVVEVTGAPGVDERLRAELPEGVRLIDRIDVRAVWDALQMQRLRREILHRLDAVEGVPRAVTSLVAELADRCGEIAARRGRRAREIERELIEQQRALSQIVQGSTIPTFVIDRAHVVTHWNRALERLTGVKADEMVGTSNHWQPFRGRPRPLMADVILDQLDEETVHQLYGSRWQPSTLIEGAYEAEEFLPLLGDSGKWCWFTAAPIKAPDGTIVGAIETLQDVSEKKRAEEERRHHNRELATLVSIYAALTAPEGIDPRINKALREILDFFAADHICLFTLEDGRHWCAKYRHGPEVALQVDAACKQAINEDPLHQAARDGKVHIFQSLPDGEPPELAALRAAGIGSMAYIPVGAADGRVFGVIRMGSRERNHFTEESLYTLELIGNRIGATIENALLQDELKRKNNFQLKLIRSSTDAIVATDDQMLIVLFNPEAERLFGYPWQEVVGRMRAFDLYPDQVEELWAAEEEDHSMSEFPWTEVTVADRGGTVIPVRYSGTILREGERTMGSVAFFQDLRAIKRLERELLHSERLAAVGQTVAGIAHGIKNILHGLKGGGYLMDVGLDRDDLDKMRSGWRMIQRNINRTSDLVMDLLSYSKQREPEFEPSRPNDLANDVCELLQGVAEENHVEIVREFDPALGEMTLDPRTVHRCLLNLVSNAVDACIYDSDTEKSHRVWVRTALEPEGRIRFEVEDNGMGISEEVRSRLFTSFFSTKGAKGTGLGLLVTRKLIEEHGGGIEVSSEPERGTRFVFRLPAMPAAAAKNGPTIDSHPKGEDPR